MNNEMYNEGIQKSAEITAKYFDEVMDYYLFSTGTGLLIVLVTVLLVLGAFVISSQLGHLIKIKKIHIEKTNETNRLLTRIDDKITETNKLLTKIDNQIAETNKLVTKIDNHQHAEAS